jgi:alpha-1,3-rhamnosyltransferase
MNLNPLVTVIIPCYNHEKYIKKCIDSVISQTYKNIEIIVIDNGSTDKSFEKISLFNDVKGFKFIRLQNNIPPGLAPSSVSIALKEATGDYISILYSDDWYLPDKIEKQVKLFQNSSSSVGLVYCHGYRYFESTGLINKWIMGAERGYVFLKYLKKGDLVIPISPLVKKYCYEIIGIDHNWTGSEYDYFVMSQFVDFDYVDEHLVVMRQHQFNDASNVFSVYNRVCLYHEKFFSNKSTIARAGKYSSLRRSKDYLIFARDFAEIGDKNSAKNAFYKALSIRPLCLLSSRGLIMIMYLFFQDRLFFKIMKLIRYLRSFFQSVLAKLKV